MKADRHRQISNKNSLRHIFHEWIIYSNRQKSISQSLNNLQEISNKALLKGFINTWSEKYHTAGNILDAINSSCSNRIIRRCFSVWKKKWIERRNHSLSLQFLNHKFNKSKFLIFLYSRCNISFFLSLEKAISNV